MTTNVHGRASSAAFPQTTTTPPTHHPPSQPGRISYGGDYNRTATLTGASQQRLFKRLGMSATHLLDICLQPNHDTLQRGLLSRAEYTLFWSELQSNASACCTFLTECIERYVQAVTQSVNSSTITATSSTTNNTLNTMQSDKNSDSVTASSGSAASPTSTQHSETVLSGLISSALLVLLRLPVQLSDQKTLPMLQMMHAVSKTIGLSLVADLSKQRQSDAALYGEAETIEVLTRAILNMPRHQKPSAQSPVTTPASGAQKAATDANSQPNYSTDVPTSVVNPSTGVVSSPLHLTPLFSLLSACALHTLALPELIGINNAVVRDTVQCIAQLLTEVTAKYDEKRITECLHALKHYLMLSSAAIVSPTAKHLVDLHYVRSIVTPLYLQAAPVCNVAQSVLQLIEYELQLPSYMALQQLAIDWKYMSVDGNSSAALAQCPLYYITDVKDRTTAAYLQGMQISACNIASIRRNAQQLKLTQTHQQIQWLNTLLLKSDSMQHNHHAGIVVAYDADVAAVDACYDYVCSKAMAINGQHTEVTKQLQAIAGEVRKRLEADLVISSDTSSLTLSSLHCTSPLLHQSISTMLQYAFSSPYSYSHTEEPHTLLTSKLTELYTALQLKGSKAASTLRFAICGSEAVLHAFACAYLQLRQRHSDTNVELLLLPTQGAAVHHRHDLSHWLSHSDSYYHRHIYQPFSTSLPFVPFVRSAEDRPSIGENGSSDDKEQTTEYEPPAVVLRYAVENYARYAQQTALIPIFRVEAWDLTSTQHVGAVAMQPTTSPASIRRSKVPDRVIPVTSSCTIMPTTTVQQSASMRRRTDSAVKSDMLDMLGASNAAATLLRDMSVDLQVSYRAIKVDGSTEAKERSTLHNAAYSHLKLVRAQTRKHSSHGDGRSNQIAVDPRTAMMLFNAKISKLSAAKYPSTNSGVTTITQRVKEIDISMVTTAAQSQALPPSVVPSGFHIVIDGESYGPFQHVTISPMYDDAHQPITLPVKHFLPIELVT